MTIPTVSIRYLSSPPRGSRECRRKCFPFFCISVQKEVCATHLCRLPFAFSEQALQAAFLQFVHTPARKMRDCKGNIPFAAGFPIGARSIPVGTRFCFAKSSVLYLCFRLTRKRGWRRTLRCGRVWRQTLFRGRRTGGFCDVSYSTNAGFSRSKIRLAGKGSRGI